MKLLWADPSLEHLAAIRSYIAKQDPAAAARVVARVHDVTRHMLSASPYAGRPGRVANTRELVIAKTPYIVAYRIAAGRITVLAVIHSSRQWPEVL